MLSAQIKYNFYQTSDRPVSISKPLKLICKNTSEGRPDFPSFNQILEDSADPKVNVARVTVKFFQFLPEIFTVVN
jgi:hypothetical protein